MEVFGEKWIERAKKVTDVDSWAYNVIRSIDTTGGIYLNTLRIWCEQFPTTNKQKKPLKQRIESFSNVDHLGGVNELSWWKFLLSSNLGAEPVPTTTSPRPDFKVLTPTEFFIEVTTLNISDSEKKKLEADGAVPLDHMETLRRILLKSTNDKCEQIAFASVERRPCCLVLFDYTIWSGYGTQLFMYLASYLLGKQCGFQDLPVELSALIYVERKVMDGRIGLSLDRSAVYYNPNAAHPLAIGTFTALRQFWYQTVEVEPQSANHWVWL
ncbi:hypothetical protein [Methylomarinum vadi]|uniref:hypothetical protein n=1 Tax=Methylomarinum vadi TaxID=438855 RepID=UPI0004DF875D|nr:hypothetical protein [Methylomarinum vadi]